jgi:hypothetical protein
VQARLGDSEVLRDVVDRSLATASDGTRAAATVPSYRSKVDGCLVPFG